MATIVVLIGLVALGGTLALLRVSTRLRDEMQRLLEAFREADRALTPALIELGAGRERLAARVARLDEPGTPPHRR